MADLSASYATRLVEDPSIICVAGERGSGKTTVLATAAAQLAAKGHVVIPPIRPEYFVGPASLISTTVAHLKTTVRADWLDRGDNIEEDESLRIKAAIERTLRQASLILYGGADSTLLRADEQAADRSLAASADSDFLDNWRTLTAEVREMAAAQAKDQPRPLIIIPVDDPDLAPGTLRQTLLDLRLMTSVDGVIGITCLDPAEARSVLIDAYMSSYRHAPSPLLTTRVVDAQIAKAFPDDRRVSIDGLSRTHRLAFKALDLSVPSIEDLCRSQEMGDEFGSDTLGTVFRMSGTGKPTLYVNALPSNPRDLRSLAYRLASISPDSPTRVGEAAIELCRTAIEVGLKQSGATDPEFWPEGVPFEVLDESVEGRPSCKLRYDDIVVRSTPAIERPMPGSKDEETAARVVIGYGAGVETQVRQRGDKSGPVQRLDPALSYAVLLIREFSHYYGVIHADITGSVPIRGGERPSPYFGVWIEGESTDNRFLNAPAWEAYYDYFVLDEAMETLMPVAIEDHDLSDRRLAIEGFFIDFCRNIVAIQRDRSVAEDTAQVSRAIRKHGEEEAKEILTEALSSLFDEFAACMELEEKRKRDDRIRVSDFKRWVERGIVNMCHDKLLRPDFIDQLLEHRKELLIGEHRYQAANADVATALESRIKAALDEKWVMQLIQLVGRFDDDLGPMLMASHVAAMEAVKRGRHQLLGETALAPLEPEAKESEAQQQNDFEIALAVLEQLEAEAKAAARRSRS